MLKQYMHFLIESLSQSHLMIKDARRAEATQAAHNFYLLTLKEKK